MDLPFCGAGNMQLNQCVCAMYELPFGLSLGDLSLYLLYKDVRFDY